MVKIDGIEYMVRPDEYLPYTHPEYNFLKLHHDLGLHERLIGLIERIRDCFGVEEAVGLVSFDTRFGGFIPIRLGDSYSEVFLVNTPPGHQMDIISNMGNRESNIRFVEGMYRLPERGVAMSLTAGIAGAGVCICPVRRALEPGEEVFVLGATGFYVYVTAALIDAFERVFHFYIGEDGVLSYDNLIHACFMIKDAGSGFEDVLIENLPFIDRWTILDTGSTDGTIDTIRRVLGGKKDGELYCEPFIDFGSSRNRLLELAGKRCKYTIMLDDTYILRGGFREFLEQTRSDHYASSFSLNVHSGDMIYGSNRVLKTARGLRYIYRIHEVISPHDNINVMIPDEVAFIEDRESAYMEKRTMGRKREDLRMLFEDMEEDPNDPRVYYYIAQTYSLLGDDNKAYEYFLKRGRMTNAGFLQERFDAIFEAARIANFKLKKTWVECEALYEEASRIDGSRPEPHYFIGIHHMMSGATRVAYARLRDAFLLGYPAHCQYSLRPTISFHFVPKFLARLCYNMEDYGLGRDACTLFLSCNKRGDDDYDEVVSWAQIYDKLLLLQKHRDVKPSIPLKPILCFHADGGFHPWTGSDILTRGMGGSETCIIEMARHIQRTGRFDVRVFCNTPDKEQEEFEGVVYHHLDEYYRFIRANYIHTVIVSRFSEYLPATFRGFVENAYLILHDLTPSGIVIPLDKRLKRVFCLTDWHVDYFTNTFPQLKNMTSSLYYGLDGYDFPVKKEKYSFIYSSFPDRGLLELLKMWQQIYEAQPHATLHIYSDIHHPWTERVAPEKMREIRALIASFETGDKNRSGIRYHGWVSKKELEMAWRSAHIWFYPCVFLETFCLTALEAARSRTVVVSNHLGALRETIGDRGIIIDGDPATEAWREEALRALLPILQDLDDGSRLVRSNYEWSLALTWEGQAGVLLDVVLQEELEYKGMYNWTNDVPAGSRQPFLDVIRRFCADRNKDATARVLEVGTYTGTSLISLVREIPGSSGVGIDAWKNYPENALLSSIEELDVEASFHKNVSISGLGERIRAIKGLSVDVLADMITRGDRFDFIYIDGSHLLLDCYADMIMCDRLLEPGGVLAIDDYLYRKDNVLESPFEAVNHFIGRNSDRYSIFHMDYRVFLKKEKDQ